jgi:hypothetical protein
VRRFGSSTINQWLTLLSMMFSYALEHDWLTRNPAAGSTKLKAAPRADDEHGKALERDEVEALLNATAGVWQLIIRTAINACVKRSFLGYAGTTSI